MKLMNSNASPFVRKVKVTLIETGLLDQVEMIDVTTTPVTPDPKLIAANPMGKIPALIRDDGPALYDSRVICRYLDAKAGSDLYPESRLWDVLTLEATADGIMEAALQQVYETRFRSEEMRNADWVEGQWNKIARTLDGLESMWMSHLNGPLDMGQIAIGCALGYVDLRLDARNWRAGRPALTAWEAAFSQRESMMATKPA